MTKAETAHVSGGLRTLIRRLLTEPIPTRVNSICRSLATKARGLNRNVATSES